ncbi:MAG: pyridoxamine 5'-phosphate oxidase [Minwuia thermotolerans]|nr:MAG: pyridoxamine 5'-phosphate oxidase [Minwuia thermotolerans]
MTDDPASLARNLIRSQPTATLSTIAADGGWPYGSLVLVATDMAGQPVLLISTLAQHTKNLAADGRASLLFDGTVGLAERLTGARVTVLGKAVRCEGDASIRDRFLSRHPSAAGYVDFGDFAFWRLEVERAHQVAGFGRINWIEKPDLLPDFGDVSELRAAEADVIGHMNADHSDAVALYANVLCRHPGVGWRLTGVDPEGADLARPGDHCRISFDKRVSSAETARVELVRKVKQARSMLSRG